MRSDRNVEIRHTALMMKLEGKSYAQVGKELGISRQRVQQLLRPPTNVWKLVYNRANGKCESCGIIVGYSGHVHHKANNGENYQDTDQLELLCVSCHRKAHTPFTQREIEIISALPDGVTRNRKIMELDRLGLSNARIGRQFGLSRERVRQIIKRNKGDLNGNNND